MPVVSWRQHPRLGKQFVANPKVSAYAFVLIFPDGVATGRAVARAIQRIGKSGAILTAGDRFTIEEEKQLRQEAAIW